MDKIKKGDEVIVVVGKDKGKRGVVLKRIDSQYVVVEGINRARKHQKPIPQKGITGGVIDKDMPIQISNLALYNVVTQKSDRVGFKVLEDGRKVRFFKSNGEWVKA